MVRGPPNTGYSNDGVVEFVRQRFVGPHIGRISDQLGRRPVTTRLLLLAVGWLMRDARR